MNRLSKRFLSLLLCLLLCCTMIPTTSFAGDEPSDTFPYGITSTDGANEITVSQLDEESIELDNIKKEATPIGYGYHIISMDDSGWVPVPGETESGYCRSPFTLMSEKSIAAFTMNVPELSEDEENWKTALKLGFVLAVEDNASGYVAFYPPEEEDNNTLTFEIPVRKEGATCAVLLTPGVTTQKYASLALNELETEDDPNDVATHHYTWNFTIDIGEESVFNRRIGQSSIQILSPEGIAVVADSVKLQSEFFEEIDPASIRQDGTGIYTIPLTVKEEYIGQIITSEGQKAAEELMTFSFDIDISSSVSPGEFMISTKLTVPPDGEGGSAPLVANAPLIVGDVVAFVSITPADMTIYEGGTDGYDGVVDEDGTEITSTSFPEPLFKIELPKSIQGDPTVLVFTNETTEQSWNVETAGVDADGTAYYKLVNTDNSGKPIRVQFIDEDGEVIESDAVDLTAELFDTYDIAIFSGDDTVKVSVKNTGNSNPYDVSKNLGTLTVRAVEDSNPISAIQTKAPEDRVALGTAVAVEPEGSTTYTLNNIGVPLLEGNQPSLLFDSIIEDDANSTARTDALIAKANEKLDAVDNNTTRYYEVKYLDLVDANNGNAWITSSEGMDIYWGYPEGTNDQTTFKLVHLKGLHRDDNNGNSGYDVNDINTLTSENIEVIQVTNKENGIKFHVKPGNFSPYVLVWEKSSTSHNPGTTPTPDPTPTPEPEEPDQPELERDDHYAYIFGYEDNTIRPENDITRAEVATIFYRLLTDESREAYRTTDHDFTDVSADAWYAEPVATLASAGLLAGYEDGSFRPDAPITRAEYAAIATRFDELAAAESNFTDISGHWAEDAINAAYGAGWVGGYEDGTFRPDQNITRAEAMALINRVLERAVDSEGMLDEMTHWVDNDPEAWYYADIQEATHSHTYEREEGEQYETWTDLVPHKVF